MTTIRKQEEELVRLRSIRAATIEECALHLIAKADLLTSSLHCGDNSMTIDNAHRMSRIFYEAAAAIRALKEQP